MKAKQVAIFGLIAVIIGLMPVTNAIAADLLPPQQAIQVASAQLQERLQDKSFTKDFTKITQFVNEVIYP
ncbi:MAG TPA: ABC transporter substrate-binding protein, partial [Methylobacter sp.]